MVGAMIAEARSYLWEHGRILEQRRFDYLFGDGPAEAVIAAVLAYRNTDGGFGHALEPDGRGPLSQPLHTYTAILRLDEVGDHTQMAAAADYLQSVASADGGVSVGVAAAASHPHAPWWSTSGEPDLLATALTVSIFLKVGLLDHPWVSAATAYCWTALDTMQDTHPYEAIAAARFLDYVPDRERAVPASERLGALVRAKRLVDLSDSSDSPPTKAAGYSAGETHRPHDFAPRPDCLARTWFSAMELNASLAHLASEQTADGGWPFSWPAWTPVNIHDWGGVVTMDALMVLRAYGIRT